MTTLKLISTKAAPFGNGDFISGLFENKFFSAKILREPGDQSINGSQMCQLTICDDIEWNGGKQIFNFCSGFDFSELPVKFIVSLLEAVEKRMKLKRMPLDEVCSSSLISEDSGFPQISKGE